MRELLYSEVQKELHAAGLTLTGEASQLLLAAIDDTIPYLSRGANLATAARARFRRFCGRIVVNARRADETVVSAATIARSRRESDSWIVKA